MASLELHNATLGHHLAMHLLRRTTYNLSKERIDYFAGKSTYHAVEELFIIPELSLPEPIHKDTLQHFINSGTEPPSGNSLAPYITAWWMEEALLDTSIGHKLEFFLHSIFITHSRIGQFRQFFDYLHLLRLSASRYTNEGFEMDSYQNLALKMVTDNVMLLYLNGRENVEESPNENFAREFLELFTIGKGEQIGVGDYTTYTEADIVESAKLLTGWSNKDRPLGQGGDPLFTDPDTGIQRGAPKYSRHNTEDKQFSAAFDHTIITGAENEEDMWRELKEFIHMIFAQKATALNICRKIYRYFVSSKITAEIELDIIEPLAATLITNDYKISYPIKQLLRSKHFYDLDDSNSTDEIIGGLIKSPFELLANTMSFFNISSPHYYNEANKHYNRWHRLTVQQVITKQAGMPFFYPDSVAGYPAYYQEPGYTQHWFNSSTLIARYKQADILLTGNRILGTGENGGVKLDIVNFVATSDVFSDPSDAEALVNDLIYYLFPVAPLPDRASYFLEIFLDDLSPTNWLVEWNQYLQNGDDSNVVIPLQTLFKAVTASQEYGLM